MTIRHVRFVLRSAAVALLILQVACVASQAAKVPCDSNLRPIKSGGLRVSHEHSSGIWRATGRRAHPGSWTVPASGARRRESGAGSPPRGGRVRSP